MNKKKKKNPAADNLIESLMNDLKDVKAENISSEGGDIDSLFTVASSNPPSEMPGQEQDNRVETTNAAIASLWDNIEQGLHSEPENKKENSRYIEDPLMAGTNGGTDPYEVPEHLDMSGDEDELSGVLPEAEESGFRGPSAGEGGYQSADDIFSSVPAPPVSSSEDDSTRPVYGEDKTVSIQSEAYTAKATSDNEKTLAVEGFAHAKVGGRRQAEPDVRVSIGQLRGSSGGSRAMSSMTSMDASLVQADNLKLAQQRILDLEKEVEKLRGENEELASAGEIIRTRTDEYSIRIRELEKEKSEIEDSHQSEVLILKGNLQYKESEVTKARMKVEDLETRLKADFKKIRVKERELENRLELVRAEKAALVRSKDEYILDMKRKIDQLQSELDNYRGKVLELNKTLESNQDQFKRTVRALRLALSNLEVKEENVVPLKKAE